LMCILQGRGGICSRSRRDRLRERSVSDQVSRLRPRSAQIRQQHNTTNTNTATTPHDRTQHHQHQHQHNKHQHQHSGRHTAPMLTRTARPAWRTSCATSGATRVFARARCFFVWLLENSHLWLSIRWAVPRSLPATVPIPFRWSSAHARCPARPLVSVQLTLNVALDVLAGVFAFPRPVLAIFVLLFVSGRADEHCTFSR
jgi:hypothetical protein